MEDLNLKKVLLGTSLLAGLTLGLTGTALAQTTDEEPVGVQDVQLIEADETAEEDIGGEVIVTGSRIKRDTFSSLAPLQVIDFDDKRDVGLIDPVTILQTTESAKGQQIDSSFGGFVLDNGPGSETIDIRGLGAGRTLVLLNSRRIAPAGVEGAPSQPSINLIPSSLIERVDILLEGASSVYGSDAVAGVVNVLLRKDFEGFDVQATADIHPEAAGDDYNISGSWGRNTDRGFIGFGAEYDFRDEVTLADRDFLNDCETHVEIDENGNIRTEDRGDQIRFQEFYGLDAAELGVNPCRSNGIAGRIIEQGGNFGSIYFVDGQTNIGIPNFIDQNFNGIPIDADGDGRQDFGFQQFSINGNDNETSLIAEQKRVNLMALGEYALEGEANITPFFEVLYSRADIEADQGTFQLFPVVGANNPFNPCGVNGSDCGTGALTALSDPEFIRRFNLFQRDRDPNRDGDTRDARICATFGAQTDANGNPILGTAPFDTAACTPALFGITPTPVGPIAVQPVVGVDGDRENFDVTIEQTRLVGGFKGDVPFLNNLGSLSDWSFETSLTHSISKGTSSREGIRDDRLDFALGNGFAAPCTPNPGQRVEADVSDGCVPVNLFAPSLFAGVVGDFATQAERDFLFDSRDFDTEYKQTVWTGVVNGTLGKTSAGNINAAFGLEYQTDQIESIPDNVASQGLFFGFFSDQGAVGEKFVRSAFGEINIPLVADQPFFRQLELDLSGRIVEDEFYGGAATYSAKFGWRPFDSLLLKGSLGTSFRSPNLRENFLRPQSGFLNLADPCFVPQNAFSAPPGGGAPVYDPSQDGRDISVLDRCRRLGGVDPTTLGGGGNNINSTEVFNEGSLDLDPEESRSVTVGFAFEQPFTESFDLNLGATYFDIDVENSVVSPGGQFIINDCFVNPRADDSPFCNRISRDANGVIDSVGLGFINLNEDVVRGIDFNATFTKEFTAFERPFTFTLDGRANHLIERSNLFINDDGTQTADRDEGEFGFSEWAGSATARLNYDDWTVSWFTRWVGSVEQDEDGIDEFGNAFGVDTDNDGFGDTFGDTCGGPAIGEVNCRDVGFADDYFVHNIGLSYNNDDTDWGFTLAVSNVFDTEPPLVDGQEVTSISNAPIGAGYDLNGRKLFMQVRKSF